MFNKIKNLDLISFCEKFKSPSKIVKSLTRLRWGRRKLSCPRCSEKKRIYKRPTKREVNKIPTYRCGHCRREFNVKTGTVLESSLIPLTTWMLSVYLFIQMPQGLSSRTLAKVLGVTQKTAWFMGQRLRHLCRPSYNRLMKLKGVIEIDVAYYGGLEKNKHTDKKLHVGRGSAGKIPVLGMVERRTGRLYTFVLPDIKAETIQAYILRYVERGSIIMTDEHLAYRGLGLLGYAHRYVNHSQEEYGDGFRHTNTIESIWGLGKRKYKSVHYWISRKHMHKYMNELAFRLFCRRIELPTLQGMENLVRNLSTNGRLPYAQLVA